jgi:small subunit ribosomal protein S21
MVVEAAGVSVGAAGIAANGAAAAASDGRSFAIDLSVAVLFLHPKQQALQQRNRIKRDEMAQVQIHDGESIESALRRFKRKVLQEEIIKEVKKHSFYVKPGEKKRLKQASARKRARKKIRRQQPTDDR